MAERHRLALAATETNDLFELAELLKKAAQEAIDEEIMPCNDPAVRLICFHTAFAGNGDASFHQYYVDIYNFCVTKVQQDAVGVPISKDKQPNEPIYKAS